jgi:hypothetical protein
MQHPSCSRWCFFLCFSCVSWTLFSALATNWEFLPYHIFTFHFNSLPRTKCLIRFNPTIVPIKCSLLCKQRTRFRLASTFVTCVCSPCYTCRLTRPASLHWSCSGDVDNVVRRRRKHCSVFNGLENSHCIGNSLRLQDVSASYLFT